MRFGLCFVPWLAWATIADCWRPTLSGGHESGNNPPCRFASLYSLKDILKNSDPFIQDALYWEGHFVRPGVGYNGANGMTYDGTLLNETTGLALANGAGRHNFSAASKESLHVMLLAQVLAGNPDAARVLSPHSEIAAKNIAFKVMKQKLKTYLQFNETFPGFGGFLPWYNNTFTALVPTDDWVNRLPALDNGELLWAVHAAIQALSTSKSPSHRRLASQWQDWLDYTKTTAAKLFYYGNGRVCAVITLNQTLPPNHPSQNYSCEANTMLLNDPYEGELFTWWLYFFSPNLTPTDLESLWTIKRPMLQSTTYNYNSKNITVQKGFWFSSHEQWKVLELPYYDIPLIKHIFTNAETARTCSSNLLKIPGMYASVNNITNLTTGEILGYISNAGIPSISFQKDFELDVITPYSTFPTILINKAVGIVWYWNMIMGKKMQNFYGTTESERIDGKGVSSFVSWDSKITTVVAILGGVKDLVREKMKKEKIYEEFVKRIGDEYARVFTDVEGREVELCLPNVEVPDTGLEDYTSCEKSM